MRDSTMCHYYESTEEWQTLWVKRAESREAEQSEPETDFEEPDPAAPSADV